MRHEGSVGTGSDQTPAGEIGPVIAELVRALDGAAIHMSLVSLDALREAANSNSPLRGAHGACVLARQLTRQMSELEDAISEFVRSVEG